MKGKATLDTKLHYLDWYDDYPMFCKRLFWARKIETIGHVLGLTEERVLSWRNCGPVTWRRVKEFQCRVAKEIKNEEEGKTECCKGYGYDTWKAIESLQIAVRKRLKAQKKKMSKKKIDDATGEEIKEPCIVGFRIDSEVDREKIMCALGGSGYKVWVETFESEPAVFSPEYYLYVSPGPKANISLENV